MKGDTAMPSQKNPDDTENPDEWQVKHWADTVMDGEKIKADPKKMKHVRKHLKMHQKAVGKVLSTGDMRALAKEKAETEGEENAESPAEENDEKKKGID